MPRSKSTPLLAALALLVAAVPCRAGFFSAPRGCEPEALPTIDVSASPPSYVVDRTLDARALGDLLASRKGGAVRFFDRYVTGLTDGNIGSSVAYRTTSYQDASGNWCTALDGMEIEVSFEAPVRIYVDRDLPESSCAYRAVYTHEMRHYEILRGFLKESVPRLHAALRALASSHPPAASAPGQEESKDLLVRQGQDMVGSAVADLMRVATARSDAIDTPAEYARVQSLCRDWIH